MLAPSTILSGIDYSETSFDALRLSSRLASAWSARLIVLHVVDRDELEEIRAQITLSDAELLERAQPQLEKTARQAAGPDVPLQTEVRIGHPFAEVIEAASGTKAELLVLGAHGAGSDEDHTGVLASRCLRKAPLPVLLVREGQHLPFTRITACVDFSDTSREALRAAALFARLDSAPLDILHVRRPPVPGYGDAAVPSGFGVFDIPLPPYEDAGEYVAHQGQRFTDFLTPVEAELEGIDWSRRTIEHLRPAHAIASFLRESQSSLVVLGTRGRTGLKGLFLGSTAEKIIHRAPCSLLAVKPAGFHFEL